MPMVKEPFNGQLNANEVFSAIFNMIISQYVYADDISITDALVDKFRIDGSLYGDTKLYYATDVLRSNAWLGDSEASNLLAVHRPPSPKCQAVTIDTFRQIPLTIDNYLTKRAFSDEGAFGQFNSRMLAWMVDTKNVYDFTLINSYVGTTKGKANKATISVDLSTALSGLTGLEREKMEAMRIAQKLADIFVEMTKDVSRDFNDYKFLRKYTQGDLLVVWNTAYVNKIRNVDLPTIFHKDGLIDKFIQDQLPSRYFGIPITSSNVSTYSDSTPAAGKPIDSDTGVYTPGVANANGTIRSLIETPEGFEVGGVEYHLFPGDEIPAGATIGASSTDFLYGEVYIETSNVICKIMHKNSIPFMSAFMVATEFWNAKALNENHYLTWGFSAPDYLHNYPFIEVTT